MRGCDAGALMARKFLINSRINGIWNEEERSKKGREEQKEKDENLIKKNDAIEKE